MLEQHENSIPVNETGDYLQSRDVEGCVKVTRG